MAWGQHRSGSAAHAKTKHIKNWAAAHAYLGAKDDRPLPGRETRLQRRDDSGIAVCYRDTDVVTYYPDKIVITCGGWHTKTTRGKIERWTNLRAWGCGIGCTSAAEGHDRPVQRIKAHESCEFINNEFEALIYRKHAGVKESNEDPCSISLAAC